MTFGKRFETLRREKGMTQQEISEDFNKKFNYSFNKSSISQYENNLRKPEIEALEKWAVYFDVSIDYLLCKTDERCKKNIPQDAEDEKYHIVIRKAKIDLGSASIPRETFMTLAMNCGALSFNMSVNRLL